jgi:hypothetical protein
VSFEVTWPDGAKSVYAFVRDAGPVVTLQK